MKRPYDPDTILIALKQRENRPLPVLPPKGIRGAVCGALDAACGGKEGRHSLLFHIFDVTTSKELTPGQWVALLEWVGVHKRDDPPPAWGHSEHLNVECKSILDSIRYNGMTEREKHEFMRQKVLAEATKHTSSMTQSPPPEKTQEDRLKEIGY